MFWTITGFTLLAFAIFQIILFTVGQLRRSTTGQQIDELELELLKTELGFLKDLRKKKAELGVSWNGIRKFVVHKKQPESNDICSFYLYPHDKKPLPDFFPGQYLTFSLNIPGEKNSLIRCYSLSESPKPEYFRVSIKRVPEGKASNYFHDKIQEGDIVDIKAPSGKFYLDTSGTNGVVLIGGGIGITPVLSMLNHLVESGTKQDIYFFLGVRNEIEHIMKEHLENIALEHTNVHLHVCYSKPGKDSTKGKDYQHACRVSVDLFKEVLPSNNFDFYFCGPGPMMESLSENLKTWGVPQSNINFETFGPSSVKKVSVTRPATPDSLPKKPEFTVTFKRSDKKVLWDGSCETILELAEANDIAMSSGCRAGNCGTCITAIKEGEVEYLTEPGSDPDPGSCLSCVCMPKSNVTLDA